MGISLSVHTSAKVKRGGERCRVAEGRESSGKAARTAVAHRAPAVNTSCYFACMCQRMIRIE